MTTSTAGDRGSTWIFLIGVFKLVKGLVLLAVGIGALRLLHADTGAVISHWVEIFRVDPDSRFIHGILAKAFSVTPKQLKELSAGTLFYAALLLTEGIGLLMRKHWAEYFTVITTGVFIPLEVFELARGFTWVKVAVLVINAAIVIYLIARLWSSPRSTASHAPALSGAR